MKSNPIHDTCTSLDATATIGWEHAKEHVDRPISFKRRLRRWLWHVLVRQFMLLPLIALAIARLIGRRRRPISGNGCEIMLTGRFDSKNWILAHLGPLSASKECSRLWMISTNPVPVLPKVVAIYPPKWLMKIVGVTPARSLTFAWAAMRRRPHVVGGFYIMPNGIAAAIVGRLTGARSMYFCVAGPPEICVHYTNAKNSFVALGETADVVVEKRLLRIVSKFDAIITMGTRAVKFFRNKGVDGNFDVVSGGIDPIRFQPAEETPSIDLILTARLVRIKRIDVFLLAVKNVVDKLPDVRAVIVGDGELREELHRLAMDLGIDHNVSFIGYQDDVEDWLLRTRIFVLTSDSEGLSLSMMEAMMCGLPAVVSNVGDLADLVEDGTNGYLVPRRSPELFADRIVELLSDERKLKAFSQAARHSALRYETQATIQRWDNILANI